MQPISWPAEGQSNHPAKKKKKKDNDLSNDMNVKFQINSDSQFGHKNETCKMLKSMYVVFVVS